MSIRPTSLLLGFSGAVLVTFFAIAMGRGLSVDEHQFVASGALLAREGMLPYRDFPFFHTPYLTLCYGLLFRASDYLLLSARVFSVICASLGIILLTFVFWRNLSRVDERRRVFLTGCAAIILFTNPVVRYSCWRAWNHSLSIFFAIAATLCIWRALNGRHAGRWFFGGGLFLSLAVGTRLSFAPAALALLAVSLFLPLEQPVRTKLQNALRLIVGGVMGAIPLLWIFVLDARAFIFGNFTWNGPITKLYRGEARHFSFADKLVTSGAEVLKNPGNLVLLLLFVVLQIVALRDRSFRGNPKNLTVLALLPCLLFGALAPAIPYGQYYYALVPFLVLGLLPPLVFLTAERKSPRFFCWSCGAAALISFVSTWQDFSYLPKLASPSRWAPIKIHRDGLELARVAHPGPILTLAPIVALEGGLRIYPALATSPFAWKTARFLSAEQRREFGFIGPVNLADSLDSRAPGAVSTREAGTSTDVLLRFKDSLGYLPAALPNGETVWVPKVD